MLIVITTRCYYGVGKSVKERERDRKGTAKGQSEDERDREREKPRVGQSYIGQQQIKSWRLKYKEALLEKCREKMQNGE